jgi:biotin carboxylase
MSKTILILAASTYQIPTITTAKRIGYRVITTDNIPSNLGHMLADISYQVDITNLEEVLNLAIKENIAGIIASGTDIAVITASYIAEKLHLIGPPHTAAILLTHKHSFRTFLKRSGFECPQAFLIANDFIPKNSLFDGRKWLIKPNRSSGSKGVFIIQKKEDFYSYVAESCSFSLDNTALLEEFVEGTQHTCEGILEKGKVAIALITDRDTAAPPYTATKGHRVPSYLPEYLQLSALCIIETVLKQVGVTSGPFDCDFVVNEERIVLIEMTPRLGGNSLSYLFKAALGIDLLAYAVTTACGDSFSFPKFRIPKAAAIAILGVEQGGQLTWNADEADWLRKQPWVDTLLIDYPQGTEVKAFINGRHRVGEALITGSDRNKVDEYLLEFTQRLALTAV